jgi:hypothetical protein
MRIGGTAVLLRPQISGWGCSFSLLAMLLPVSSFLLTMLEFYEL